MPSTSQKPTTESAQGTKELIIGHIEDNAEQHIHNIAGTSVNDVRFRYHRGNLNIDDFSPVFSMSKYEDILVASDDTFTAFSTACVDAMGTWWTSKPLAYRTQQFETSKRNVTLAKAVEARL